MISYEEDTYKEKKRQYYNLIWSEEELKYFFDNILPPLKDGEVYFVSLSARKKFLTDSEREKLQMSRTEMFQRQIIRKQDWNNFLRKIKRFEVREGAYTTKNNSIIPQKILMSYVNINPSDSLTAYKEFNKQMVEYMHELAICASEGRDTTNIMSRISKQDRLLMNCYQKATGTKHWIDIDLDVPHNGQIENIIQEVEIKIEDHFGAAYTIQTQGGYHLLISKDTEFDRYFNSKIILEELQNNIYKLILGEDDDPENYEIEINKNSMIPLPGLLQANFPVRIINKV